MSKYIIMSDEIPEINKSVLNYGFEIIKTDCINTLLQFETQHADMQCLKINDTFFVLKEAVNLRKMLLSLGLNAITTNEDVSSEYPKNVLLNAVYLNNKLYCKKESIAKTVHEYCINNNIEIINVNQGYTKCSTAVFGNCFITADRGIFEAMSRNGEDGLLIESGDIDLNGVEYGFIGGCSFFDDESAFFTGDISRHKNFAIIKDFLKKHNINTVCLSKEILYDIGGFIVI